MKKYSSKELVDFLKEPVPESHDNSISTVLAAEELMRNGICPDSIEDMVEYAYILDNICPDDHVGVKVVAMVLAPLISAMHDHPLNAVESAANFHLGIWDRLDYAASTGGWSVLAASLKRATSLIGSELTVEMLVQMPLEAVSPERIHLMDMTADLIHQGLPVPVALAAS